MSSVSAAVKRSPSRGILGAPLRTARARDQSVGALSAGSGDEQPQSGRRGTSAGPGGRGGFRPSSRQSRDPRPVGDRAYAMQCARNVAELLHSRSYGKTLAPEKFLRDPSTREFFDIFKFLIAQIDPNLEVTGPMDQEVPQIMKRLKYPVEVARSKLQAISGPNTWPQLLAVLDWLINLIKVHNQFILPAAAGQVALKSSGALGGQGSHVLLQSLRENYMQFLNGRDAKSDEESLRQIYEDKIGAIKSDLQKMEERKSKMDASLQQFALEHEKLLALQREPAEIREECERVVEATRAVEGQAQRLHEDFETSGCQQHTLSLQMEALQDTVRKLTAEVELQPHSKREIERLKSARESLRRMLADLKLDGEKAEQEVWDLQLKEQKAREAIQRLLRSVDERAQTVEQALRDAGVEQHKELRLRADPDASSLDAMILIDFEQALQQVRAAAKAQERLRLEEEAAGVELLQEQRTLQEETAEKERECQRLRARLEQLERIREENRMWSDEHLEDAQRAAEEAEDQVAQSAMGSAGPSVRDTAEVDELRLYLNTLRTQGAAEMTQLREKVDRERERRAQLREAVEQELETYADCMETLAKDVVEEAGKGGVDITIAAAAGGS
eukprot:TRINITY_DN104573_c0_g1_i1.p1 TRINITY_DN104573_c0_g1~~TRINITY_DN104573_c0_g1_i1.p1  ORF type:complete len:657 (-),score=197.94 TRINITY_DN104573_c0_g1_i1:84-1934(-)